MNIAALTVTYNHERYIDDCIASVVSQTIPVRQHVIVDNGSTDNTWKLLCEAAFCLPIQVHRLSPPVPIAQAYAHALSLIGADWVAILDGDDYWLPERCEIACGGADKPDVAMWFSDVTLITESGEPRGPYKWYMGPRSRPWSHGLLQAPLEPLLRLELSPPSVGMLLSMAHLQDMGGFITDDDYPSFDLPTLIGLGRTAPFGYIPGRVGMYRKHSQSVTVSTATDLLVKQVEYCLGAVDRLGEAELPSTDIQKLKFDLEGLAAYGNATKARREGDHRRAAQLYLRAARGAVQRDTAAKASLRCLETIFRTAMSRLRHVR